MKKLFSISLGVFLITILFLGVYNFAFKNNPKSGVVDKEKYEEEKEKTEKEFAESSREKQFQKITDVAAFGTASIDEKHIAYFNGGKLRKISLGGGGEEVLIDTLPDRLVRAVWSPKKEAVLGLFSGSEGNQWHLIRLDDRSVTPLKRGILNVSWFGTGEKIFYSFGTGKQTVLSVSKPDGTEWKEIGISPVPDPYLETAPDSVLLSLWTKPNGLEETSLWTIPITGGNVKKIFSGKFGGNYLWSPRGGKFLVSASATKGPSDVRLGIANQTGGEYQTLQAPTFVPKASWSSDGKTIYYALPTGIPDEAVLPNDYFGKPIRTRDSFWKIDTETGKSERVIEVTDIPGDFDAVDLFLDQKEEFLFFTNRTDGSLYRIRIQ